MKISNYNFGNKYYKGIFIFLIFILCNPSTSLAIETQLGYYRGTLSISDLKYELYVRDEYGYKAKLVELEKKRDYDKKLIIPEQILYNGQYYEVAEIAKSVFAGFVGDTLSLPNTLWYINDQAFSGAKFNCVLTFPENLKAIGKWAFFAAKFKGNLILPENIAIGEEAFRDSEFEGKKLITPYAWEQLFQSTNFEDIVISDKVTKIGDRCFAYIKNLKHIKMPQNLEEIGVQSFIDCENLKVIDLAESFKMFKRGAFNGCKLDTLICRSPIPPHSYNINEGDAETYFGSVVNDGILLVPEEAIPLYKEALYWQDFKNIYPIPINSKPASLKVIPEEFEMRIGERLELKVSVLPDSLNDLKINWESSNENIASVSADGIVHAISEGNVTITATCEDVSATCEVTVIKPDIEAAEIILNVEIAELNIGETVQLEATVLPEDSIDKTVIWRSSNEDVVAVTQKGLVIALSTGRAIITASCGGVMAACEVIVQIPPIEAEQIIFNLDKAEINIGETLQLEATVLPEDTTDKTVVWRSSDDTIATVSETGLVTANSVGTVSISASCGEVSATCEINVIKPIIEAVEIILNVEIAELNIGEILQLEATVSPEETSNKKVVWNSSDENIASISDSGLVTAISAGKVTITGRCGEVFATCLITVINPIIEAESIQLNIEEAKLRTNETLQLEATVLPETTTDKTVIWSSSDESVAIVSETGLITALSEGSTIVTATNGKITNSCLITVTNTIFAEELKLNTKKVELKKGSRMPLKVTIYPENTTDKTIIWNSTNDEVASVSEEGLVTAISAGETVITATCGEASASCEVIVIDDSGVESLLANPDSNISIYSPDGILIKKDCKVEDLKSLAKGIYIIVSGNERYKIYI